MEPYQGSADQGEGDRDYDKNCLASVILRQYTTGNQPVLVITLELNTAYSALRLLISFREEPCQILVCYVLANTTTGKGQCVTSIWFPIHIATVSYHYMSHILYCKIHLVRSIFCYCTLIHQEKYHFVMFYFNHHKNLPI